MKTRPMFEPTTPFYSMAKVLDAVAVHGWKLIAIGDPPPLMAGFVLSWVCISIGNDQGFDDGTGLHGIQSVIRLRQPIPCQLNVCPDILRDG